MHDQELGEGRYLPNPPRPLPVTEGLKRLGKVFRDTAILTKKLFTLYEDLPIPPDAYPAEDAGKKVSAEQRQQCKEIFDLEEARLAQIESKSNLLFATVAVLVPLCLSALTFMWRSADSVLPIPFGIFSTLCLLALLCLLGAIVAVIRIRSVSTYQTPGIGAIIDPASGAHREYDRRRDAYCLLWCASMNAASAGLRVDFLRAGQLLSSGALMFLVLAAVPLGGTFLYAGLQTTPFHGDEREALEERIKELEIRVHLLR